MVISDFEKLLLVTRYIRNENGSVVRTLISIGPMFRWGTDLTLQVVFKCKNWPHCHKRRKLMLEKLATNRKYGQQNIHICLTWKRNENVSLSYMIPCFHCILTLQLLFFHSKVDNNPFPLLVQYQGVLTIILWSETYFIQFWFYYSEIPLNVFLFLVMWSVVPFE